MHASDCYGLELYDITLLAALYAMLFPKKATSKVGYMHIWQNVIYKYNTFFRMWGFIIFMWKLNLSYIYPREVILPSM